MWLATTNTVMLRAAHCLGPLQDNHQERPVASSFTMLGAPPDPGSVHLHSSHHRVLDSSGLQPSHQDAKGRGRSYSLSVTDSYFWGRPDMLGLMKHSTDISAVTAHLTFIRLLLPELLFFSFLVPRTHVNTREVILVSFRNGSRKCNFPKFLISKFNGHSLFCIISLLFQFYTKNKTLLHLLTFSR